ncbi:MAG: DUF998 domain-containing protein [Loktanella sp.]|nr:DUF998 domain-containing protein [Loktanella sp.]
MVEENALPAVEEQPTLMIALGSFAIFGCFVFAICIYIADIVVPNHDWVSDTISDLAAGEYELIVDVGIYFFSGSIIATALLAAHVHLGGWRWSVAIVCLAILGLVVFLVGARNEYGDNDSEGVVIHVYLVYAIGALVTAIALLMAKGAAKAGNIYRRLLLAIAVVWAVSAPIFFFLPDDIDGAYERYLGFLAFALIVVLSKLFISRGRKVVTKI